MRRLLLLSPLLVTGCDAWHYHAGRFLEARGRYARALTHYEGLLAAAAPSERSAEIRVRAGWLYAERFGQCAEARRQFEAAVREAPRLEPWAERARRGLLSCPDYFPLSGGRRWVHGDGTTGGKIARIETEVQLSTEPGRALLVWSLYAGKKKLRTQRAWYEKSGWAVWEDGAQGRVPVLRYPFRAGQSWTAKRKDRAVRYSIEEEGVAVETIAGKFSGCLKVREQMEGLPSWKYDFYCPSVGKVLTTVAGEGFENRNTELLSLQ